MLERLPAGARTPQVARAVTAPSAVLLAGAGASVAILAGLPLAAAAGVGVVCWGARVASALPRRRPEERIDPRRLGEPWKSFAADALAAQARFERAVRDTDPGPLRDRLVQVGARVGVAVRECWRIARRGHALDQAVAELDVDDVFRQVQHVEGELDRHPDRSDLRATADALRSQLRSAHRLESVAQGARDRLRRLDAELNEAVARAVELSLSASDVGALQPLGSDVDALVDELESLRQALEETGGR